MTGPAGPSAADAHSPAPLRGRCLCGAVRYTLMPPTVFASHCHCETCRRAHSAAFVTWTKVPTDRLTLTGDLTLYPSSPGVLRGFCPTCGTQMTFSAEGETDTYLPLATLTDPPDRRPDSHVSWEEHAPWIEGLEDLPRYLGKSQEPAGR